MERPPYPRLCNICTTPNRAICPKNGSVSVREVFKKKPDILRSGKRFSVLGMLKYINIDDSLVGQLTTTYYIASCLGRSELYCDYHYHNAVSWLWYNYPYHYYQYAAYVYMYIILQPALGAKNYIVVIIVIILFHHFENIIITIIIYK